MQLLAFRDRWQLWQLLHLTQQLLHLFQLFLQVLRLLAPLLNVLLLLATLLLVGFAQATQGLVQRQAQLPQFILLCHQLRLALLPVNPDKFAVVIQLFVSRFGITDTFAQFLELAVELADPVRVNPLLQQLLLERLFQLTNLLVVAALTSLQVALVLLIGFFEPAQLLVRIGQLFHLACVEGVLTLAQHGFLAFLLLL